MSNQGFQDEWSDWLSPNLFSGNDMQGNAESARAARLDEPYLHDR